MINAIGLIDDRTITYFVEQTTCRGIDVRLIDLSSVVQRDWSFSLPGQDDSWVNSGEDRIKLDPRDSYYCRLTDLSAVCRNSVEARHWRSVMIGFSSWLETIPGCVINRPGHWADNSTKPLHEALLAKQGFRVPTSITSSDGTRLRAFASAGPAVVKAVSGARVDCRHVDPDEFIDFDTDRGPVHLQRFVAGFDVRAHVVANTVHSERIVCETVDYRIANDRCSYDEFIMPPHLQENVVVAASKMGLIFSGWDFKVTPDGEFWCLEVNPMPGYNSYDSRLGGRITNSLIAVLQAAKTSKIP